jgi:Flp pilus assembly protein TadB
VSSIAPHLIWGFVAIGAIAAIFTWWDQEQTDRRNELADRQKRSAETDERQDAASRLRQERDDRLRADQHALELKRLEVQLAAANAVAPSAPDPRIDELKLKVDRLQAQLSSQALALGMKSG